MELGTFSLSLTVKDIAKSKLFYETLGFTAISGCGSIEEKWLMLKKGDTMLGLFQEMFEENILTFNPKDARSIEAHLKEHNIKILKGTEGDSGPTHLMVKDPDGNLIMFDQF